MINYSYELIDQWGRVYERVSGQVADSGDIKIELLKQVTITSIKLKWRQDGNDGIN